jgi:hypothetical protein
MLSVLKPQKNLKKDLEKVRKFSSLVSKQLENFKTKNHKEIEKLTYIELQDFHEILRIADFLLTKHEANKDFHSILKEFVEVINNSADSVETLDDEICELVISAENTINRFKTLQGKVANDYDIDAKQNEVKIDEILPESSGNNLTNSSTRVYPQEYQQNSRVEAEQVI